jgi:hypothetical protein
MPANKLKSSTSTSTYKENVLYVEAANEEGSSWLTLSLQGGQDVYRLFSQDPLYEKVPQIYSVSDDSKNAVQFLSGNETQDIDLGVFSKAAGAVRLGFKNVESFGVSSLVLEDKLTGLTYDLQRGSSEVVFDHVPANPDRFVLRVGTSTSGTPAVTKPHAVSVSVHDHRLLVEAGEGIDRIILTNVQGLQVLTTPAAQSHSVRTPLNLPSGVYIVKVVLVNGGTRVAKVVQEP